MANPVKIDALEVENVKRVKAVAMEPAKDGLTVIGGRNGQGKTSVIDAIAWALGGERFRPANPKREGAAGDARLKVVLDNGIVVERKGKNGALKVSDPAGRKAGQKLLDTFVETLALDLPRFLNASDKERAEALLGILGIGDELAVLDKELATLENQRLLVGQQARAKRGHADSMPFFADAPDAPVSAAELIRQQQEILARNGENQRKREQVRTIEARLAAQVEARDLEQERLNRLAEQMSESQQKVSRMSDECVRLRGELAQAAKTAEQLEDESTEEIEASIAAIEETNAKVRENQARREAEADADELEDQYREMGRQVDDARRKRMALLDGADLPVDGLGVEDGRLTYNGQPWGNMSGSEQLRVATAIVRRLKPECGFVLVDKLEQMDPETLAEFAAWAQDEGLQVIGTRVGTGDECSIVIEDGYAAGSVPEAVEPTDGPASAEALEPALVEPQATQPVTPPWALGA
ncbi:MAG: AAA family ATPase [Eggerthellaceae bacterium]|nr:AAA family ATPase [Eggerthellaceae bacterium]